MNSMACATFRIYIRDMITKALRPRRPVAAVLLLGLGLLGLGASGARAADDSPWDGDARSAARLLAGARAAGQGAPLRAGIEIRLGRGWHTYWRYPGDAGVPPHFDFAGSQNVKAVEVLWPAPRRLPEAGLDTIGYDRDLILPLHVTPQDAAKPVTLSVKLDYAICEKLCVPAQTKGALALTGARASRRAGWPPPRPASPARLRSAPGQRRAPPRRWRSDRSGARATASTF